MNNFILIVTAIAIGIPRVLGVKTQFYQAIAHLFIGGVITYYYLYRESLWLWIIIILSILEIVCFIYFRKPTIKITHVGGIRLDDEDIGYKQQESKI